MLKLCNMIRVIAGGKKSNGWLVEACGEYEKRLRKPFNISWDFVDEEKLPERVARLDRDCFVVLLDERGEILSSPELSQKINAPLTNGREVVFVLGGAFGHFSDEMKQRADFIWSFSRLVFPHQICRLMLTEQIYRAQEIALGHPYHHA
jgi:23S rRNA (pseudouridine1915-N3)-methyltransferase